MHQLGIFDSRTSVVLADTEQADNLDRVSTRIQNAIVQFCDLFCGRTFHADQLMAFVTERVGTVAPGSADRVLRSMRQRGLVSYEVVNRASSLYRILA